MGHIENLFSCVLLAFIDGFLSLMSLSSVLSQTLFSVGNCCWVRACLECDHLTQTLSVFGIVILFRHALRVTFCHNTSVGVGIFYCSGDWRVSCNCHHVGHSD